MMDYRMFQGRHKYLYGTLEAMICYIHRGCRDLKNGAKMFTESSQSLRFPSHFSSNILSRHMLSYSRLITVHVNLFQMATKSSTE